MTDVFNIARCFGFHRTFTIFSRVWIYSITDHCVRGSVVLEYIVTLGNRTPPPPFPCATMYSNGSGNASIATDAWCGLPLTAHQMLTSIELIEFWLDFRFCYFKSIPPPSPESDLLMMSLCILCRFQIWLPQTCIPLPESDLLLENLGIFVDFKRGT